MSVVLFILSFKYVEYDEIALRKNVLTNTMDLENVYGGGRYLWLINESPVPFPATYQFVDFDDDNELIVFDKKGLSLQLYSSFQYRIVKANLGKLFQRWGYSYHDQVVNIARAHLKNQVAALFDADDYFRDRLRVQVPPPRCAVLPLCPVPADVCAATDGRALLRGCCGRTGCGRSSRASSRPSCSSRCAPPAAGRSRN